MNKSKPANSPFNSYMNYLPQLEHQIDKNTIQTINKQRIIPSSAIFSFVVRSKSIHTVSNSSKTKEKWCVPFKWGTFAVIHKVSKTQKTKNGHQYVTAHFTDMVAWKTLVHDFPNIPPENFTAPQEIYKTAISPYSTQRLFLFGSLGKHLDLSPGSVFLLTNPDLRVKIASIESWKQQIMGQDENSLVPGSTIQFSVHSPNQICFLGKSKYFGRCSSTGSRSNSSINKDLPWDIMDNISNSPCNVVISTEHETVCPFHAFQDYSQQESKFKASRMNFQGIIGRKKIISFQKEKIPGGSSDPLLMSQRKSTNVSKAPLIMLPTTKVTSIKTPIIGEGRKSLLGTIDPNTQKGDPLGLLEQPHKKQPTPFQRRLQELETRKHLDSQKSPRKNNFVPHSVEKMLDGDIEKLYKTQLQRKTTALKVCNKPLNASQCILRSSQFSRSQSTRKKRLQLDGTASSQNPKQHQQPQSKDSLRKKVRRSSQKVHPLAVSRSDPLKEYISRLDPDVAASVEKQNPSTVSEAKHAVRMYYTLVSSSSSSESIS